MADHIRLEIHSDSHIIWARIGFTNYTIHVDDRLTWGETYEGFKSNVAWLISEEREIPVLLWFLGIESQTKII